MAKKRSLGRWISKIKLFRKNPGGKRTQVATLNVHGKTRKQSIANARRVARRHVKNVEMGYYDSSGFHPIRASSDYSAARAGEGRSSSAKRARARKSTKRARRGRTAIS